MVEYLIDQIEPAVRNCPAHDRLSDGACLASIAISLKRIADHLDAVVTDQREGRSPAIRTAARQA